MVKISPISLYNHPPPPVFPISQFLHSLNGYPAHLKNVSLYLTTTYISYFRFTASLWSRMYLRSIV